MNCRGVRAKKYEVEEDEDAVKTLSNIAKRRACMLKGGELDLDKAAKFIMDDFRNGRIAKITLEKPEIEMTESE